jgi:hypothetical protein
MQFPRTYGPGVSGEARTQVTAKQNDPRSWAHTVETGRSERKEETTVKQGNVTSRDLGGKDNKDNNEKGNNDSPESKSKKTMANYSQEAIKRQ